MTPEEQLQALQEKFNFLVTGVHQGRLHLETLFGDFESILEECNLESRDFMFGHLTGMMEMLRHMLEDYGEEE
jgi:hypothetical protein